MGAISGGLVLGEQVPSMWHMVFLPGVASAAEACERSRLETVEQETVAVEKIAPRRSSNHGGRRGAFKKKIEAKMAEIVAAEPGIDSGNVVNRTRDAFAEFDLRPPRLHVILTNLCAERTSVRREGKRGSYTHYPMVPSSSEAMA